MILLKKARQEKKVKRYLEDNFKNREGKFCEFEMSMNEQEPIRTGILLDLLPRHKLRQNSKFGSSRTIRIQSAGGQELSMCRVLGIASIH